jgi:hypothetical protein
VKIVKQIMVGVIASTFAITPNIKTASGNPAILAPVALCAGTAGAGCVLIGVAFVSGITYYVWQSSNGKRVFASSDGSSVLKIEDPEEFEKEVIVNTYGSSLTPAQAEERCKRDVSLHGLEFAYVRKKTNGTFECVGK